MDRRTFGRTIILKDSSLSPRYGCVSIARTAGVQRVIRVHGDFSSGVGHAVFVRNDGLIANSCLFDRRRYCRSEKPDAPTDEADASRNRYIFSAFVTRPTDRSWRVLRVTCNSARSTLPLPTSRTLETLITRTRYIKEVITIIRPSPFRTALEWRDKIIQ